MKIENGVLVSISLDDIVNGHFSVPKSVHTIGENAFKDCERLNSILVPANVERICANAFKNCKYLKMFGDMPDSEPNRWLSVITLQNTKVGSMELIDYLAKNEHNVIRLELPKGDDPYTDAGNTLRAWLSDGTLKCDNDAGIYIYEEEVLTAAADAREEFSGLIRACLKKM